MPNLEQLILQVPTFLLALAVHEWAHAVTAVRLGDKTPIYDGRVTLNPIAHLSLFGTLLFFFAGIGWAKPVRVNMRNLANPVRDMVWIALAGPLSNFGLAIVFAFAVQVAGMLLTPTAMGLATYQLLMFGVHINVVLGIFNLLPIPPLDGWKIFRRFLPVRWAYAGDELEPMGFFIILILFRFVGFGGILFGLTNWVTTLLL